MRESALVSSRRGLAKINARAGQREPSDQALKQLTPAEFVAQIKDLEGKERKTAGN
ncbi:MAG TPA: hypothetical protein VJU61_26730 [Polyangiaceae bacterium]|nr:hypothetical protein [Polyangiaceae bacterium]